MQTWDQHHRAKTSRAKRRIRKLTDPRRRYASRPRHVARGGR